MKQMIRGKNIALLACRQQAETGFYHVFCSTLLTECCTVSLKTREITSVFPLYEYYESTENSLWDKQKATSIRRPNLSSAFIEKVSNKIEMLFLEAGKGNLFDTFGPEDIFNYMYAIFHSPTYRERYAGFLKIDFPRLPLTSYTNLFRELCMLGERLVALHVMEQFGTMLPSYPVAGNNMVEKVDYLVSSKQSERGRIYINKTQYFDNIPQTVWEFHIGGYQVCHKWLKDRKGRILSYEDIRHYQKTVAALAETIELMEKIDEVIEEHGGWPIE